MSQNRLPNAPRQSRFGFTLIELLIVIAIIAIISAFSLTVLNSARQDAYASRSKTQVFQLSNLVMERWEGYQFRQLPIDLRAIRMRDNIPPHRARLYAMRELMRLEMPDRYTDFIHDPNNIDSEVPFYLRRNPALFESYRKQIFKIQSVYSNTVLNQPITKFSEAMQVWRDRDPDGGYRFQGAECLYMIVSTMENETGRALDRFRNDIGDVDDDGMYEILDAWGNPIEFIRWPAGFNSAIQTEASKIGNTNPNLNTLQADSFDPFQVDPRWTLNSAPFKPFALTPLVYSAGRDQLYGLATEVSPAPYGFGTAAMPRLGNNAFLYAKPTVAVQTPSVQTRNDPYYTNFNFTLPSPIFGTVDKPLMGFIIDPTQQFDNIDNHFGVEN